MSETTSGYRTPLPADAADRHLNREHLHHVSWGAIFLALAIAIGVQVLLGLLGIAIGFRAFNPADPSGAGAWGIATSLYVIAVQIISLLLGGYIAAQLSPARTDQSAMLHGASIWALATIVMIWLGTTTAGMVVGGVSSAVSNIGNLAGQAVEAAVPDDFSMSLPDIEFQDLPEPVQETLRENGITPDDLQQEVYAAYRQVVTEQEQQQVVEELQQAATRILRDPTNAPEQIEKTLDDIFGQGGILTQQDLDTLERTLKNRLNLSDQEVQEITNQIQQRFDETRQAAQEAFETAQREAIEGADWASSKIASIALWTFIASLLGLIAAVIGGKVGVVKDGIRTPTTRD